MLVGNVVALLSPLIFIPILTYVPPFKPQKYDWVSMALISKGDEEDPTHGVDPERAVHDQMTMQPCFDSTAAMSADDEKKDGTSAAAAADFPESGEPPVRQHSVSADTQTGDRKQLDDAAKIARFLCVALALVFIVLWPMPLFGTGYVFSRSFFTGWTVVGIIWLFCSAGVVVFLPLWQSRSTIVHTARSIVADVTGKGRVRREEKT